MQTYDLVMLGVLVLATLFGAWKGLAWQVASISSIFVSFFVAVQFREPVAGLLSASSPWNKFLAMLILFLGCSLLIWILFRFVSELIDQVKLKGFDRHAGAVVGLAHGVLWCVIITLFAVTLLGRTQQQAIVQSRSGHYIALLLNRASAVMPDELQEVLAPYMRPLDQRLEPHQRWSHRSDSDDASGGGAADDSGQRWPPPRIANQPDVRQEDPDDAVIRRWLNNRSPTR